MLPSIISVYCGSATHGRDIARSDCGEFNIKNDFSLTDI
jgi:hypothetical protein